MAYANGGKPGLHQHPNRVWEQQPDTNLNNKTPDSGCARKGIMPCGWGVYKLPPMKILNGIKYCCPSEVSSAQTDNNRAVGNMLEKVFPGCAKFSDSAAQCCIHDGCRFTGTSCLRNSPKGKRNEDKCASNQVD